MIITVNGDPADVPDGTSLAGLLLRSGHDPVRRGVAIALNGEVVPRGRWAGQRLLTATSSSCSPRPREADVDDPLVLAGETFSSRLILGTGGASSLDALEAAVKASGTEIVTVALRRLDPTARGSVLDVVDRCGAACCRTRPAATPPAMRCSPPSSPARPSRPTG